MAEREPIGKMLRLRVRSDPAPAPGRASAAALIALLAAAAVAIEHGFDAPPLAPGVLRAVQVLLPWLAVVVAGDVAWRLPPPLRWRRIDGAVVEVAAAIAAIAEAFGVWGAGEWFAIGVTVLLAVRLNAVLARTMRSPALLFPASFLVLIAVSTAMLKLPAATPSDQPIGWVDACFTATSAVCVTGLAVRDTASGFTPFGQVVVLASIQLGGLGVMIFGSTLALLLGIRPSYRERITLSMALDEYPAHRIARFAWFIVLSTFALEAVGAALIYFLWPGPVDMPGGRLWNAVFHSVSAFCNAGFDITGQSMVGVRGNAVAFIGVMPMIILGGIGFLVLEDVYRRSRDRLTGRTRRLRLSTHSRVVLTTTAALLVGGFVLILIAQTTAEGALTGQRVLDAAFMSVTARTAGFNTVPMDELSPGSRFTLMMLMAIGGSPGSTAGGMRTAVFAVLVLAVVSTVRGRGEVEVFGRALPDALVKKAATVAAGLFGVIAAATLALDLTERMAFEPLLFEVISAATTTGLSLGATGELTPVGRVVITVTMFLGRVGALSLIAALLGAGARGHERYQLPRDTVSLG